MICVKKKEYVKFLNNNKFKRSERVILMKNGFIKVSSEE